MKPMLPKPIDRPKALRLLDDPRWGMDEKVDGVHALVQVVANGSEVEVTARSRNGLRLKLPSPVVRDLRGLRGHGAIELCGELAEGELHLFDVAAAPGVLPADEPWQDRRFFLQDFHRIWDPAHVWLVRSAFTSAEKHRLWDDVLAAGGEGVVFKAVDAPYRSGEVSTCLKWKQTSSTDVFVGALRPDGKHSVTIHQLDEDGRPFEVGAVAITDPSLLRRLRVGDVLEVKHRKRSKAGRLIEARLVRPRPDLSPTDCRADKGDPPPS